MRVIVFLMLVLAMMAIRVAENHDWESPQGQCASLLISQIENNNGNLVINGRGGYKQSCDNIDISFIDCVLRAQCRNTSWRYQKTTLTLTGDLQKVCCK